MTEYQDVLFLLKGDHEKGKEVVQGDRGRRKIGRRSSTRSKRALEVHAIR
jgi:hypothetical protein